MSADSGRSGASDSSDNLNKNQAREEQGGGRPPSPLPTRSQSLTEKLQQHQTELIVVSAGALIAFFIWVGIGAYYESRENKTFDLFEPLYQRVEAFDSKQETDPQTADPAKNSTQVSDAAKSGKALRADLASFAKEHAGSKAAAMALFYAGDLAYREQQYDEAIEQYQAYLKTLGSDSPYRAVVVNTVAYAYEAKGDFAQAASYFEKAASREDNPQRENAVINTARAYGSANNISAAQQWYEKFVQDYPNSKLIALAKFELARLQGEAASQEK